MIWLKRAIGVLILAAAAAAAVWFAWPAPVRVDLAAVARGPMEVTVEDDGRTRVRHVYTVSAPIAGRVLRISHPAGHHKTSIHVGGVSARIIRRPITPVRFAMSCMRPLTAARASAGSPATRYQTK